MNDTKPKNKKSKTWIQRIDAILMTLLLLAVIYAYIEGTYIRKEVEVIETCNNKPITIIKDNGTRIQIPQNMTQNDTLNYIAEASSQ